MDWSASVPQCRCPSRYFKDGDEWMPMVQATVTRNNHIPWSAHLFGGFFPRTGGDIVIATGEHTQYPGNFNTEHALSIFRAHVPR